ncbi:collagen, type I, alpha 1a-like [Chrysemys picta bellii]|uniref:collagen, type I, alpha 1a-like n=1 Tax=Chrysemys picta bellii TaxID=8478 RepID=UPI0032B1B679
MKRHNVKSYENYQRLIYTSSPALAVGATAPPTGPGAARHGPAGLPPPGDAPAAGGRLGARHPCQVAAPAPGRHPAFWAHPCTVGDHPLLGDRPLLGRLPAPGVPLGCEGPLESAPCWGDYPVPWGPPVLLGPVVGTPCRGDIPTTQGPSCIVGDHPPLGECPLLGRFPAHVVPPPQTYRVRPLLVPICPLSRPIPPGPQGSAGAAGCAAGGAAGWAAPGLPGAGAGGEGPPRRAAGLAEQAAAHLGLPPPGGRKAAARLGADQRHLLHQIPAPQGPGRGPGLRAEEAAGPGAGRDAGVAAAARGGWSARSGSWGPSPSPAFCAAASWGPSRSRPTSSPSIGWAGRRSPSTGPSSLCARLPASLSTSPGAGPAGPRPGAGQSPGAADAAGDGAVQATHRALLFSNKI